MQTGNGTHADPSTPLGDPEKDEYWQRLIEWPFAYQRAYTQPVPQVIKGHAIGHLNRALNIGRVTAFVGSGVSMAYGRLGWTDLLRSMKEWVCKATDSADPRVRLVKDLLETVPVGARASQQLGLFQVVESLATELRLDETEIPGIDRFRRRLMGLVYDRRGLLFDLLSTVSTYRPTDRPLEKDILDWERDTNKIIETWQREHPAMPPFSQDPIYWYRAAAAALTGRIEERQQPLDERGRPAHDPLQLLLGRLGIRRFVTTNYDWEIERLLKAQGLRASWGEANSEVDPLQPMAQDLVFSPDDTGKLTVLVSQDRASAPWIIHLHGRANLDGTGRIVATEEHYRELYVRNDQTRSDVDDAMRLIYGSSPILFIGVGMSEVDLLHPLRQLLSTPTRVGDRIAIAIMPALGTPTENKSEQIELLTKYGVYSIFYGDTNLHTAKYLADAIADAGKFMAPSSYVECKNAIVAREAFVKNEQSLMALIEASKGTALEGVTEDLRLALELFTKSSARSAAAELYSRGALNAMNTILLCDKLEELESKWRRWWTAFRVLPRERPATATAEGSSGVVRRHAMTATEDDRFYGASRSQALDSLVHALEAADVRSTAGDRGRMFLLIAPRGIGKGHFMSVIQEGEVMTHEPTTTKEGLCLSDLLAALGVPVPPASAPPSVATYNLGHSIEVNSVIDSISLFLWQIAKLDLDPVASAADWEGFEFDRLGRLRFALGLFRPRAGKSAIRPVIVINAANVLFDGRGQPKNPQIRAVLQAFHDTLSEAAIDVFLIVTPRTVPAIFRTQVSADLTQPHADTGDGKASTTERKRETVPLVHLMDLARSQASRSRVTARLRGLGLDIDPEKASAGAPGTNAVYYVHWLKTVQASVILIAFYARLARIIAKNVEHGRGVTPTADGAIWSADFNVSIARAVRTAIRTPEFSLTLPRMAARIAVLLVTHGLRFDKRTPLPSVDDPWVKEIDEFSRRIHRATGKGRYPLTLILSAVEATVANGLDDTRVHDHLERLCDAFERVPMDRRVDVVIATALDEMRTGVPHGGRLHDAILWHLAVIGQPVERDVLIECPDVIAASAEPGQGAAARQTSIANNAAVETALDVLVARSLVYKMKPSHASRATTTDDGEPSPRYCIHRLLQRHILRRLGAPYVEQPDVDRLSLTMFASQPNDMAAVTPEMHKRLSRAVETLTGYPDNDDAAAQFALRGSARKSQMLRAAFGMLRTTHSVASVVRYRVGERVHRAELLSEYDPGLIERHRHQLRWLLSRSAELFPRLVDTDHTPPFYAEEIAWLYNESGVLSLVQGQLKDAIALFQLADRSAEAFEKAPTGPVRSIILLNTAIVDIERGVFVNARAALQQILDVEEKQSSDIALISGGYVGVITHLTGYAKEANAIFDKVIPRLTRRSMSRAAAIFARFQGDLARGQGDTVAAGKAIDMAIRLAGEDHHEDVRQVALLAQARLRLETADERVSAEIHAVLDGVEAYARRMGIAKLTCKALETRARLHRRNGDLRTATSLASSALEIASQNELRVRKAALLVLMADLAERRGMVHNAEDLLKGAMQLADKIHYHSASLAAQRVADRIRAARIGVAYDASTRKPMSKEGYAGHS